jgi:predicted RNA-binding protein with PUA-like domain
MNYWLVKEEPEKYSWADLLKEGRTSWTGVRNFQARNNLRAMKKGDAVLYYQSVSDKKVVGVAKVVREPYPDPTADDGDWVGVDLAPVKTLAAAVSLDEIKADAVLREIALVKQGRLSVMPLTRAQFERLLKISKTDW